MIKRFNEYEKLLESKLHEGWLDSPLKSVLPSVKTILGTTALGAGVTAGVKSGVIPDIPNPVDMYKNVTSGKSILSNPDTEEVDPEFVKLYETTPIGALPANVYLRLSGLRELDDESSRVVLESHLSEENSMLDIANNYYIVNIGEIISSIDSIGVKYITRGIEKTSLEQLNTSPITVGTILSNSFKNWFNSGVPSESLIKALSEAKIHASPNDQYKRISESFDYDELCESINESASADALRSARNLRLLQKLRQVSATNPGFKGYVDDFLNFLNKSAKNVSSATRSGTLPKATLTDKFLKPAPSLYNTPNVTTPLKEPGLISKLFSKTGQFFTKAGETFSKSFNAVKNWFSKRKSGSPSGDTLDNARKGLFGLLKNGVGFMIKKPLKWGAMGFAGYWIADWFGKKDAQTGKEPTRELFTFLEEDLSARGYTPFNFYVYASKAFVKIVEDRGEDWVEILKGWCQSMNKYGILSSNDYNNCLKQINSPTFVTYMKEHSNISTDLMAKLQDEWKKKIELPSLGLYTVGIMSSFTALMSKFENELYNGNVPLLNTDIGKKDIITTKGFMSVGDKGEDVAEIQTSLKVLGIYKGNVNGIYDEETKKAVETLQKNAKISITDIEANGKVDPKTFQYIQQQLDLLANPDKIEGGVKGSVAPRELEFRKEAQDSIERMKAVLADR